MVSLLLFLKVSFSSAWRFQIFNLIHPQQTQNDDANFANFANLANFANKISADLFCVSHIFFVLLHSWIEQKWYMTNESQNFDKILDIIRKTRRSDKGASVKITEVSNTIAHFEDSDATTSIIACMRRLRDRWRLDAFANKFMLYAEGKAMEGEPMTAEEMERLITVFEDEDFRQCDIYVYPSFQGVAEEDEAGNPIGVSLPDELKGFKGGSMLLKLDNMDRLMDTFCSRDTRYRRAYSLLADLDKELMECIDDGVFPYETLVPYKEDGDVIFRFSHFEVDLAEPDEAYRTLYVVYHFESTIS